MKTIVFLISIFISTAVVAQDFEVKIANDSLTFDDTRYLAVSTSVDGTRDEVAEIWKAFLKEEYDIKSIKINKTNFIVEKEVVIPEIIKKRGDLILQAVSYPSTGKAKLTLSYRLGYDICVNPVIFSKEYTKMQNFLEYFGYYYYNEVTSLEIADLRKKSADLEKEKKHNNNRNNTLENSNKNLDKNITSNNTKIEKKKDEINKGTTADVDKTNQKIKDLEAKNTNNLNQIELNNLEITQNTEKNVALDVKISETKDLIDIQMLNKTKIDEKFNNAKTKLK
jgi:hypothetical protein